MSNSQENVWYYQTRNCWEIETLYTLDNIHLCYQYYFSFPIISQNRHLLRKKNHPFASSRHKLYPSVCITEAVQTGSFYHIIIISESIYLGQFASGCMAVCMLGVELCIALMYTEKKILNHCIEYWILVISALSLT